MESLKKPMGGKRFFLQPSHLIGLTVVLIVLCFFAYLWVEYRQFVGSPDLTVSTPTDGQTVEIPSVLVEGKTDPDAKLKINDQDVGLDKEGNFKEDVKLSGSSNDVTITSTSKFGQTAKEVRKVFVKK
jgi:hypothetical protein